jgi:hypothetical protein
MKLFMTLFLGLFLYSFSNAATPAQEYLRLTGSCTFTTSRTKTIDIRVFSRTATGDVVGAHVIVSSLDRNGEIVKTLARYDMDFAPAKGLSLIFKFQNLTEKTSLEIFGDDMGGMSTLTVKVFPVTCMLEQE